MDGVGDYVSYKGHEVEGRRQLGDVGYVIRGVQGVAREGPR